MTKTEAQYVREKLDEKQRECYKNFSADQWLSRENNFIHLIMWITFYRRNLHIFVEDYLGIKLYPYQKIILYFMGRCSLIVIIASRAAAKSFIIAIYSCCKAILYPGSEILLTSGTKGQSALIVSKKIKGEILDKNPSSNLHREIKEYKKSTQECQMMFGNGSMIFTVTCGDSARGNRSTVNVNEEARTESKTEIEKIITPCLHTREIPFTKTDYYAPMAHLFTEEPTDIYISSSIEETHWLYNTATKAKDEMLAGQDVVFFALDYAIALEHNIRTRSQMIQAKKDTDPITWAIEYENQVLRDTSDAYFTYDVLKANRILRRPFYPRRHEDVINNVRNPYAIPKQEGEIRIVACDIATINRKENDNSVYACLRLYPEASYNTMSYKVQLPYLEAHRGFEPSGQAVRIRELYEDFEADYIVLDVRNAGIGVYEHLAKTLYDQNRGTEYKPLRCMNDDTLSGWAINDKADPVIYLISGSAKLNSDMANNLQKFFTEQKIDLLVSKEDGKEDILRLNPEYAYCEDSEELLFFNRPYLETMFLIKELMDLKYEIMPNTRLLRLTEQSGKMKDRYSAVTMGCYFIAQLERDLISQSSQINIADAPSCVSFVDW